MITIKTKKGIIVDIKEENYPFDLIVHFNNELIPCKSTSYYKEHQQLTGLITKDGKTLTMIAKLDYKNSQLVEELIKKIQDKKQKEKEKKYKDLIAQLPQANLPVNEHILSKEDLSEIKNKIKKLDDDYNHFSKDPEDSGIALSISSQISQLHKKIKAGCDHQWEESLLLELNCFATRTVKRINTCKKCNLSNVDEVSDPIPQEAMWR